MTDMNKELNSAMCQPISDVSTKEIQNKIACFEKRSNEYLDSAKEYQDNVTILRDYIQEFRTEDGYFIWDSEKYVWKTYENYRTLPFIVKQVYNGFLVRHPLVHASGILTTTTYQSLNEAKQGIERYVSQVNLRPSGTLSTYQDIDPTLVECVENEDRKSAIPDCIEDKMESWIQLMGIAEAQGTDLRINKIKVLTPDKTVLNYKVTICNFWTNWVSEEYTGFTLADCIENASKVQREAKKRHELAMLL